VDDRAGVPVGTYRLHVEGKTWNGEGTTWPWGMDDYTVDSAPFEVVPATITVSTNGSDVSATMFGPPRGYRLIEMDGYHNLVNPLHEDSATLEFTLSDGTTTTVDVSGSHAGGYTTFPGVVPAGAVSVKVIDVWGNEGTASIGGA
jgi:hypothetical protein